MILIYIYNEDICSAIIPGQESVNENVCINFLNVVCYVGSVNSYSVNSVDS